MEIKPKKSRINYLQIVCFPIWKSHSQFIDFSHLWLQNEYQTISHNFVFRRE